MSQIIDLKDSFRKNTPDQFIENTDNVGVDKERDPKDDGDQKLFNALNKKKRLEDAMKQDPGYPILSWRMFIFTSQFLLVLFCSGDNGFDATVMGSINSMTQYQRFFGLTAAGSGTGLVFGMYTIGQLIATIPIAYLPDVVGRRWSMVIGNVFLIFGAVLTSNAQNKAMFITGRFFTGFGCSIAGGCAKNYAVEITPSNSRGRWIGVMNCFYYIGQIIASGVTIPTGKMTSDYSWRLPLYVQAVPALFNAVGTFIFLPESPRFLYARGHKKQAAQILANLHSSTKDPNSPLVRLEIEEIEEALAISSGADTVWWDYRPLFRTRADRYRSGMVILIGFWGQFSGNGIVTYFLTVALGQAGITSPDRQRVLNFVNSITSFIAAMSGAMLCDHIGRRACLLFAMIAACSTMAIIAALLSNIDSSVRATAGVSFIYLFMALFSCGMTPMQAVYPSEVLPTEIRAKGLGFLNLVASAASCINTFGLPSAMATLGWKTYLIFVVVDAIGIFVVWQWAVETKKVTLEEIDSIFQAPNPKKFSLELTKSKKRRGHVEDETY